MRKALTTLVLTIFLTVGAPAMAIEEPQFEVIHMTQDYEVRRYEPFIVAEVDVDGDMGQAGNQAFRILAGYIFGNNESGEKMQMTAPVVSDAPQPAGETYTYAFVMEAKYSVDTLPAPVDPRIRIVEKPGRVIAARQYNGRWTEDNYRKHEAALISSLTVDGLRTQGNPYLARYDGPFKPWFMRRNEVLVELDWQ